MDSHPTLIFLHLPKTGGQTLGEVISRNVGEDSVVAFDCLSLSAEVGRLRTALAERPAPPRVVRGHMPFGLHRYLPGPSTYVTLVRDPVERAVSIYYFAREHPSHHLHRAIVDGGLSLEQFALSDLMSELANGQTRLLSGVEDAYVLAAASESPSLLDLAIENVTAHFALAGALSRFDESLMLLQSQFGWRDTFYVRRNVGLLRRSAGAKPDRRAVEVLRQRNQLDLELYQFVTRRLDEVTAAGGEEFQRRLSRFRRANRVEGRLRHTGRALLRRLRALGTPLLTRGGVRSG